MATGAGAAAFDLLGRRRIADLRALADERGWEFADRDDRWAARLAGPPFEAPRRAGPLHGALTERARHRRARHVLTGSWHGRRVVAFDYSVRTVASAGFGQAATATLRYAVCTVELPAEVPRLDILAAPGLARSARFAGRPGIELESEDFNRACYVSCASSRFATDVLQPPTMRLLLDGVRGTIRLAGRHAVLCRRGRLTAADVPPAFALLGAVVDAVPAFVWADSAGPIWQALPERG